MCRQGHAAWTCAWHCPCTHGPCQPGICRFGPGHEGRTRCQFPLRPGGTHSPERVYEKVVFPLGDGGRPRRMVLYLDRTTELQAQRHLVFTERLASLGRTVQGVAHELNTPLATIQTLAGDMKEVVRTGGPATEVDRTDLLESATLVTAEVERCRRITHALLGRAEHLCDGPARTTLADAVQRAVAVVFAHERGRVAVELAPEAAARTVPLDTVVQVLVNLLQNARDAAQGGPVRVSAAVGPEGRLVVCVSDAGPGLAPEASAHLFEPFFTTKPAGQGTGLGLYTSYTLLQGLGGELALESSPGGGAVATVRLPASA